MSLCKSSIIPSPHIISKSNWSFCNRISTLWTANLTDLGKSERRVAFRHVASAACFLRNPRASFEILGDMRPAVAVTVFTLHVHKVFFDLSRKRCSALVIPLFKARVTTGVLPRVQRLERKPTRFKYAIQETFHPSPTFNTRCAPNYLNRLSDSIKTAGFSEP